MRADRHLQSSRKPHIALLLANIIGAAVYLLAASRSWAIPEQRGLHSQTGEPFVWACFVLPIWALYLLLNLTWGAAILVRREWRNSALWLAMALIWLAALGIDFAHH